MFNFEKLTVVSENPQLPKHLEQYIDWSQCPPVFVVERMPSREVFDECLKYIKRGND